MSKTATTDRPHRARQLVYFLLTLALSAGLITWLLSATDPQAVWDAAREADPGLLALAAVASVTVNALFAADRWRVILDRLGVHLSLSRIIRIEMGCSPIKVFLPLKSGELLKAYTVARLGGVHFERIVGSKVMDKYLILLGLAAVLAGGAALAGQWPVAAVGAAAFLALLLFLSPASQRPLRFLARAVHPRLELLVRRLLSAFEELPAATILYLIAHSLVYNLLIVGYLALCFLAVGVRAPAGTMAANLVLLQIAGLFPASFAGLGVREGAALVLFAGYGTPAALLAGGLCATVVDQFLFPVVGLSFFPGFLADLFRRTPRPAA